MAKRITWSENAKDDFRAILDYWKWRNQSSTYSRKLKSEILQTIHSLSQYPNSGKPMGKSHRYALCGVYQIWFYENLTTLEILHIFDGRRDPSWIAEQLE